MFEVHFECLRGIYPAENGREEIALKKEVWAEDIQAYKLVSVLDSTTF